MAERAPQANRPENQGAGRFEALRSKARDWMSRLIGRREVTLPASLGEDTQAAPDSAWSSEGHPDWVIQEPERPAKGSGEFVAPAGGVLTADGWKTHREFESDFSTVFMAPDPNARPSQPANPTMGRTEVPGLADRFVTARFDRGTPPDAWDNKPETMDDILHDDLERGAQLPPAVLGVEELEPTGFRSGSAQAHHAQLVARSVPPVIK